jgi:hypothetical protein
MKTFCKALGEEEIREKLSLTGNGVSFWLKDIVLFIPIIPNTR